MRHAQPSKARPSGLREAVPQAFNSSSLNEFRDPMKDFDEKPLPPTPWPRPASSIYSIQKEDIIDAYGDEIPIEQLWTSQKMRLPSSHAGDNRNVARLSFAASRLSRGQLKHSSSDSVYIIGRVDSTASNKRRSAMDGGRPPRKKMSVPLLGIPQSPDIPNNGGGAAVEQAKDYQDVLTPRPLDPLVATTTNYRYDDSYSIVPLSPRIIDVIDRDLPDALSTMSVSDASEKRSMLSRNVSRTRNASSTRSGSSSRNGSTSRNVSSTRNISRSPPRQATPLQTLRNPAIERVTGRAHVRAASDDEVTRQRARATPSPMSNDKGVVSQSPRRQRAQSLITKHRTSLQNSLNIIFPVSQKEFKPPHFNSYLKSSSFKPASPKSHHTPAIPITPYQEMGIKALIQDSPPKPRKTRPKTIINLPSLVRRRNSSTKRRSRWSWHGFFHLGFGGGGEEREKARRREELKKKIVVIGPANPNVPVRYPYRISHSLPHS